MAFKDKSPAIQQLMKDLAKDPEGLETGERCATCSSEAVQPTNFRDDLSRKEFTISGMCQKCQDSIFGA